MFSGSFSLIDVSMPLSPDTPVWPGDPEIQLRPLERIADGAAANVTQLICPTHCGTHVDPPRHFVADGASVDAIPVERWIGPCQVVSMPEDVTRVEAGHLEGAGVHEDTTRLLLRTRNSSWGLTAAGSFSTDYAAVTPAAARWVVDRGIKLVGIDALSIECFDDAANMTHRTLLGNDVLVIEGLRLERVAPGKYILLCLPLKIADGDGAPARVVLMVDRTSDGP